MERRTDFLAGAIRRGVLEPCRARLYGQFRRDVGARGKSNARWAFMTWDFVRRGVEGVDARFRYVKKALLCRQRPGGGSGDRCA